MPTKCLGEATLIDPLQLRPLFRTITGCLLLIALLVLSPLINRLIGFRIWYDSSFIYVTCTYYVAVLQVAQRISYERT